MRGEWKGKAAAADDNDVKLQQSEKEGTDQTLLPSRSTQIETQLFPLRALSCSPAQVFAVRFLRDSSSTWQHLHAAAVVRAPTKSDVLLYSPKVSTVEL